jgi:hypothetical protein
MNHWRGTGRVADQMRQYRPFRNARAFVRKLGLKSEAEWRPYCKSEKKPEDIPATPSRVYAKEGWSGMGDWLGTGAISHSLRQFQPFKEAREFARSLGLKSGAEWQDYCKSGKKPEDIPAIPSRTYAKDGWAGMGDWLGTGKIAPQLRQFRPFEEARAFARRLGLKSETKWREYSKSGSRPADIPSNPNLTYRDTGWSGWGDWLGNVASFLQKFRPFKEARKFARSLGLKSSNEWREYSKSGSRPADIPSNPNLTYRDAGWSGWGDWLGTGRTRRSKS